MILIGVLSMISLFYWLLKPEHRGNEPLYWLLMFTIFYLVLKVLHEWYHYFFITVPKTPPTQKDFTVDVFTTFCTGEPYEMIQETLYAIKAIKYPHESYLCDDAHDPRVKTLCEELGIHYVTREGRKDAKAGNINNGLKHSSGELCVILDPDHVPSPDFLDPIVSHFNNPEIGFVQIVQAYKNKHESLVAKGAAQQTFQFYGPMMMSMNRYGTVQAIGANCTFRRAALDSIGGHAPGLAEDMHTAMLLHAKGWQSTYVPAVLARGLVPSTLSAYFKQQLKWTRGTFELLIATYPKVFKYFSFRQRLHYGILPFHYFSGVIFLMNFIIPILALFFAVIPLKTDLLELLYVSFPFVASMLLIRHYVQRWVMEETERGFHVVGGILQIGTWWINTIGIFYAILRKEVPYDPTPKDGKEGNPWKQNVPNLIVGILSLSAIIYGLSVDWNPFSLLMAFLAALNCGFVIFMLMAGLEPKYRQYRLRKAYFDTAMQGVKTARKGFWLFRHLLYRGFRIMGLPLVLVVLTSCFYLYNFTPEARVHDHYREHPFYAGMFVPQNEPNLSDLKILQQFEQSHQVNFDIVSLYLGWGDKPEHQLPKTYIEEIYSRNFIPMITWEPWASDFISTETHPQLSREKKVMKNISNGYFDEFIRKFALDLKGFNKPVFLRFAHEPDNPAYPWSESGENSPEDFRNAWRHVHQIFAKAGASNVIWVWNPWSATAVADYFPGEDYFDWVGLTTLNYDQYNANGKWKSFEYLYESFDSTGLFEYNYPVMLAEFGSLENSDRQTRWFSESFKSMYKEYPEVRALVFFNSDQDKNVPGEPPSGKKLDWRIRNPEKVLEDFASIKEPRWMMPVRSLPVGEPDSLIERGEKTAGFLGARGINFRKGKDWVGNYDNLAIREVSNDFAQVKQIGTNILKWYGPGVYDRNVLNAAKKENLQLLYSFWIPSHLDYEQDLRKLSNLEDDVLSTIRKYKDREGIAGWNLGNGILKDLRETYYKPKLYYQQEAYLEWLKQLVVKMKKADPSRPVSIDLSYSRHLAKDLDILQKKIPAIDVFGIIVGAKDSIDAELLADIDHIPYFFSNISTNQYIALRDQSRGVFISSWKDQRTSSFLSFTGLNDYQGRHKEEYFTLRDSWRGGKHDEFSLPLRIITPAAPVYEGQYVQYITAYKQNAEWKILQKGDFSEFELEWFLVKLDQYGNPLRMRKVGKKPKAGIHIPGDYENYRLMLFVFDGEKVHQLETRLNMPYHEPEAKETFTAK